MPFRSAAQLTRNTQHAILALLRSSRLAILARFAILALFLA
jgi:hypothetical protein